MWGPRAGSSAEPVRKLVVRCEQIFEGRSFYGRSSRTETRTPKRKVKSMTYVDQRVNGVPVQVPVDPDGMIDTDVLRRVAGVRRNRPLIHQQADGINKLINPGERLRLRPGQEFMDASLHDRGQ